MPDFIPGIELCRRFYREAVRPVLDAEFPGLKHAAALIGPGSEVLGFDTEQSTDHHWGPRAMLFFGEEDYAREKDRLFEVFRWRLPHSFLGYPTNFAQPVPEDPGTRLLKPTESGPVDHRVEVYTVPGFARDYLGFNLADELTTADWLSFPQQRLLTLTAGEVYHDEVGVEEVRTRFAYYPRDIWLYLLGSQWARIAQEEHLVGRAGQAGDDLGASLIAARLVNDAMRLCFLMERRYWPYAKWFGTAFIRLSAGPQLAPLLGETLAAQGWQARSEQLTAVYEFLARKHNALALTPPLPEQASPFWGRPFPVIHGDRFAEALFALIEDGELKRLAQAAAAGNIDQMSDNVNVLENTPRDAVKCFYQREDMP
jgi:hypothetical protein